MDHEPLPTDRPGPLEPPEAYERLRRTQPVARVGAGAGAAWLVTSFDIAAAALGDRRLGVSPPGGDADNGTLLQDGDHHARLRRLVGRAFTPNRIAALADDVAARAEWLVLAMAQLEPPVDVVEHLAAPLALGVIADLLGIAGGDLATFRPLADAVSAIDVFGLDATDDEIVAATDAWAALTAHVAGVVTRKRDALGSDLLSDLIRVHDEDDGRLSDDELVSLAATMVAAGYRTATTAIALAVIRLGLEGALVAVADAPQPRAAVVEEVLRIHAGQVGEPFPRYALEDLELGGVRIAAGDVVLVRLEAAHRDPDRFADPDRFDPGRGVPHMAFGRGAHHCLGAALARSELDAALAALGRHLPGVRLHGSLDDIEWTRGVDAAPSAVLVTW